MKFTTCLIVIIFLASCGAKDESSKSSRNSLPIQGTWKLLSGTLIENGDTTVTDYTNNTSFIKIINENHFAFLTHSVNNGKDSSNHFDAGGGSYSLLDSTYTENLEYCLEPQWEGHSFTFTISIRNDTLTQKGIEKIDSLGVNRLNIEKYVRLKK